MIFFFSPEFPGMRSPIVDSAPTSTVEFDVAPGLGLIWIQEQRG